MASRNRRGGFGFGTTSLTGPGTVFTIGFIALAIAMGLLLSRGVTPKSTLTDPGQEQEYEMVPLTPDPAQKGLQLKTLKFRSCASTITIDMMLDRSGSMSQTTPSGESKLQKLKDAVKAFTEGSNDQTIIGIQSFDSNSITNDVPVGYYKDVKNKIAPALDAMSPGGQTPTHDALVYSYNILKTEVTKYPTRKFNFIFISDGAPVPPSQDPNLFNPNPATQIKDLGVNVYTLGIFAFRDSDPRLAELLRSIASPGNYYAASTGDQVKELLKQISTKICNQEITPTPLSDD